VKARIYASLVGIAVLLAGSALVLGAARAQEKAPAKAPAREPAATKAVAEPAVGQYKIGVVNRKQAFDNYERQKQEFTALEAEVKEKQTEIDKLSELIKGEQKQYDDAKASGTMTPEQLTELEEKVKSDFRKYRADYDRLQKDIDSKHMSLIKRMKQDIDSAVAEIGNAENFHLILEGDPNSPQGTLYYASSIDITPRVIERLNSKAGKENRGSQETRGKAVERPATKK